jgi:hypothetical protein
MVQVRKKTSKVAAKTATKSSVQKREIISIHQFSKIAMTFWLGGTWMAGIVIFPVLFKTLDQITASELVSQILNIQSYIGIICLIIAFIEVIVNHRLALLATKRFWYILCMFSILVVEYFAIFPMIYALREKISLFAQQLVSLQNNAFDFWHSFSAILFILTCFLGMLYLIEM